MCSSKKFKTTTVSEPPFYKLRVCRFVSIKRDFVSLNDFSSRMVQCRRCFNAMHYFEQALGLQIYMKETLTLVFSCQICKIPKIQKYKNFLQTLLFSHRSSVHNLARVQNLAWFKTWRGSELLLWPRCVCWYFNYFSSFNRLERKFTILPRMVVQRFWV